MTTSTLTPALEASLRRGFRRFNKFMLTLFRLGLGSYGNGTRWGGWIMVLSQRGRKSGLLRRTPLNYAVVGEDVYCTAGFGAQAHWYRNILANPNVELWLVEGRWAGIAEDISDSPQRLELLRKVLIASGFASLAGRHRSAHSTPMTTWMQSPRPTAWCASAAQKRSPAPAAPATWPGSGPWQPFCSCPSLSGVGRSNGFRTLIFFIHLR